MIAFTIQEYSFQIEVRSLSVSAFSLQFFLLILFISQIYVILLTTVRCLEGIGKKGFQRFIPDKWC